MAWLSILTTLVDAAQAEQMLRQHADQTLAHHALSESALGDHARTPHAGGASGETSQLATVDRGRTAESKPDGGETSLSQGALMAHAAIDRLTGRVEGVGPQIAVHLVMTPDTLTGTGPGREMPAHVLGVGPLPARTARDLLRTSHSSEAPRRSAADAEQEQEREPERESEREHEPEQDYERLREREQRDGCARSDGTLTVARPTLAGPDWDFDDITREERLAEADTIRGEIRRDSREASRVTLRRIFVDADGRTFTGMDARVGVMPAPFRQRLGDPDGDRDGAMSAWLSLLRSPPQPEDLVPLDSMARLFMGLLRRLLLIRDKSCRAPWCGAPIRHLDHAHPWAQGGATSAINGNGDCAGHNLAKESPGYRVTTTSTWEPADWLGGARAEPGEDLVGVPARPHTVTWVTPTGRTVSNTAPPPLGWGTQLPAPADVDSPLERRLAALLRA